MINWSGEDIVHTAMKIVDKCNEDVAGSSPAQGAIIRTP
jgi:hypothetical protein